MDHQVTPVVEPAAEAGEGPGGCTTWSYRVGAAHATGSAMVATMVLRESHSGQSPMGTRNKCTQIPKRQSEELCKRNRRHTDKKQSTNSHEWQTPKTRRTRRTRRFDGECHDSVDSKHFAQSAHKSPDDAAPCKYTKVYEP